MKYGSTVNGLCLKLTSDLDLTILTKHQDSEIVLNDLVGVLKKYGNQRYEFSSPRRDRAGWILNFRDNILLTDIDLMVNKVSEILNSEIIREYSMLDQRFVEVTHFLKAWNK